MDVLELRIAIRVSLAFLGLAVSLQAVALLVQQFPDLARTHPMSLPREFICQLAQALACPA